MSSTSAIIGMQGMTCVEHILAKRLRISAASLKRADTLNTIGARLITSQVDQVHNVLGIEDQDFPISACPIARYELGLSVWWAAPVLHSCATFGFLPWEPQKMHWHG